ncbi:uncharacterized protein PFLUO_LOCUS6390 [Penicillium psychrofluorescens]|uniref:uncharacterized protein n=1 Tax=Penicillium psychrofluorescens TaxID=3158075 RepID=UPI003CCCBDE3
MILETFTRVFVNSDQLDQTLNFYTKLLDGEVTLRFAYPDKGLVLGAVSSPHLSVLVIAGQEENLAPFRATHLTIKVDQLEHHIGVLTAAGSEILEPIQDTPTGRKTRFRHPDGLVVEYMDFRSQ